MKKCARCKLLLPPESFKRSGTTCYCLECWQAYWSAYKRRNRDSIRASWRKARIKRRAQEKTGPAFSETAWAKILKKARHLCVHCGKRRKLTIDHILPLSKGGTNHAWNLQPLCKPCNSSKSNVLTGAVQLPVSFASCPPYSAVL